MNPVVDRIGPGQHGTVGRQCKGNRGGALLKQDAFFGELVNIRGGLFIKSVAAEVVGAGGIHADQDDMFDRFVLGAAPRKKE